MARCVGSGPRVLLRELVAGLGPRQVVEERRAVQKCVVRGVNGRVLHVDDVASGYRGPRLARRREVAFQLSRQFAVKDVLDEQVKDLRRRKQDCQEKRMVRT